MSPSIEAGALESSIRVACPDLDDAIVVYVASMTLDVLASSTMVDAAGTLAESMVDYDVAGDGDSGARIASEILARVGVTEVWNAPVRSRSCHRS